MHMLSGRAALALCALALLLYVVPLARPTPLIDPDEGLHASISQEMVERGDLITPRFLGEPFLDKPVLFFWTQAASLRLFGMNEAAVRLPGLVLGLLGAITTGLLAAVWMGRGPAVVAACFYATLLLPIALNQAGAHDVTVVVWTNLALLFLWRAHEADTRARTAREALFAGVALGLAILTKGLVGPAFTFLAYGATLIVTRGLSRRSIAIAAGAGLGALLVAAPWYVAMEAAHPGYLHYYFIERHVEGFVADTQRHGGGAWWFYVPLLLAGAFPWVLYVPAAIGRARRADVDPRVRFGILFSSVWVAAGVIFLSLASSKLATYALPLCPPIAILAAAAWTDALERRAAPARSFSVPLVLHAVLALGVAIAAVPIVADRFHVAYSAAIWIGPLATAVLGALVVGELRAPLGLRTLTLAVGVVVTLSIFAIVGLLPAVASRVSARDLAVYFNDTGQFPERLRVFEDRIGSLVFYLRPEIRATLTRERVESFGAASLEHLVQTNRDRLTVAIRETRLDVLERMMDPNAIPFRRAGQFRLYEVESLSRAVSLVGYGDRPAAP